MGKLIPELISILSPTRKKKERHDFSEKVKREAVHRQKGRCGICSRYMNNWERDFHHRDGNKSNNNPSNCQAVHTRCHRKTHAGKMSSKRQTLSLMLLGLRR
jgi:5-methylcytosine-specific restriction endonuclease McrA